MSSRPTKREPQRPPAPPESSGRPTGRVPQAMVSSRRGTVMISRSGRGFSIGELSSAGLARGLASGWGLSIDVRRRSVLEGNVGLLKVWGTHQAPSKKEEGRVRKAEVELVEVERLVKKEAAELKKEVAKAEKVVKRKAVKVEKKAKAKKAKPKAKPKQKKKRR